MFLIGLTLELTINKIYNNKLIIAIKQFDSIRPINWNEERI